MELLYDYYFNHNLRAFVPSSSLVGRAKLSLQQHFVQLHSHKEAHGHHSSGPLGSGGESNTDLQEVVPFYLHPICRPEHRLKELARYLPHQQAHAVAAGNMLSGLCPSSNHAPADNSAVSVTRLQCKNMPMPPTRFFAPFFGGDLQAPSTSVVQFGCSAHTPACKSHLTRGAPLYLLPPCCARNLDHILTVTTAALKKYKVEWWLNFGSLLGSVRYPHLHIKHDPDEDLRFVACDCLRRGGRCPQ